MARAAPDTSRILRAIGFCLLVLHAAQTFAGDLPLAGVLAAAIAGGYLAGWRLDVLRSVRTAVVLLVLLSVACVLGTLTVQRAQIGARSEGEYVETLSFAWAHLAVKVTHPLPGDVTLPAAQQTHLERLATTFGDELAAEQRESLTGSLAAHRDEEAARALVERYPGVFRVLYRAADSLRFTDLFLAWWFHGLFYLLSANLLVGAIARRRPSLRNVGFHGAHLGLVLIVAGALIGAFGGERGVLPLTVGEGANDYLSQATSTRRPLGFAVRLDRFETLYHEDLHVEALIADDPHAGMGLDGPAALRRELALEVGASAALTDPETGRSWTLTVEEITAASGVRRTFAAVDRAGGDAGTDTDGVDGAGVDGEGAPLAAVLLDAGSAAAELEIDGPLWLTTADGLYVDPRNRAKLRLERATERPAPGTPFDDAGAAAWLGCEPGAGTLTLVDRGGEAEGEPKTVRVEAGATFTLGRFTGRFDEVIADFRVDDQPPGEFPRNPALRLHIGLAAEPDDGAPLLLFSDPRLKGFTEVPWDGVELSFDYDYWCTPAGGWIRLWVLPDGSGEAWIVDGVAAGGDGANGGPGAAPTRVTVAAGDTLSVAALDEPLTIHTLLADAVERTTLLDAGAGGDGADGAGATDDARTAIRLRIDGPDGPTEAWLLSNGPDGAMWLGGDPERQAGSGFALLLADNRRRPPRDWKSHLTFLEEGAEVSTQIVEVNVPAHHDGYAFFQSDADAARPDYTGLQVVRDPGWPIVATGLWLLLLGIPWCFYVQPWFDRRSS